MLRASLRQTEAIKGMSFVSANYFKTYVDYLKKCRDHERFEMENSNPANTEILKGKCRMLSEQITNLESLFAKSGE